MKGFIPFSPTQLSPKNHVLEPRQLTRHIAVHCVVWLCQTNISRTLMLPGPAVSSTAQSLWVEFACPHRSLSCQRWWQRPEVSWNQLLQKYYGELLKQRALLAKRSEQSHELQLLRWGLAPQPMLPVRRVRRCEDLSWLSTWHPWEEEASTEEPPPADWPVDMSVGPFPAN